MKRFSLILSLLAVLLLLGGCVHYVPRPKEETGSTTDAESTTATTVPADITELPNEADEGYTKRY